MDSFLLNVNPNYSVDDYKKDIQMSSNESRSKIAENLKLRYLSRYIYPGKFSCKKNGFNIMASCCLLIETLESFNSGWRVVPNGTYAFCKFFNRVSDFKEFTGNDTPTTFYKNIRCGILHQGETTGGWRIRRDKSPMLNLEDKIINADRFLETLEKEVVSYFDKLKTLPRDSDMWQNFVKKMDYIIKNCGS